MSARPTLIGGALALSIVSASARAGAQIDTSHIWRFDVTPYGWATSLDGRVGVGPVATNVDLSFHDILKHLKFGFMVYGEARHGPWFFGSDIIYASLGDENVFAIRGDTGQLELRQKEWIVQPVGGYTIGNEKWALDFLGGFRYWDLSTTIDVDVTRRPTNPHTISQSWVDATVGARFRAVPYKKVHVVVGGDGGGGGSHGTWNLYGMAGYDVWSKVALGLGYRYLFVNYESDRFLFDTKTKGLALGASIHW
jgi:hypothetical protein